MKHTQLYSFQAEDVRRIQREFDGRAIIANEVGLGKTLTSLYWAWKYLPDDPPGPIVCVVPAHLKLNWEEEARKHLGLHAEVLWGRVVPEDYIRPADPNVVYVVNYDILVPPRWKAGTTPPPGSWLHLLTSLRPRLVIADEGHYLSNPRSVRTRAVQRLCRDVPHVLVLTGTPMANKPPGMWSLLNLVRPELYPSEWDFCCKYTYARLSPFGWVFPGAKNLDALHADLSRTCMIRRRKRDVLHQLPPVTRTVVPIPIDRGQYDAAERGFAAWFGRGDGVTPSRTLEKLNTLRKTIGVLKTPNVVHWVRDALEESDGKILLGAHHYDVTGPLMEAFRGEAVLADGRMDGRAKDEAFRRFNTDPGTRVLVGNIQAAGTGWNCTCTSTAALAELPWRPADVEQFVGRIDGIGRGLAGTGAHVYFLVAPGTVEDDLCRLIQEKAEWSGQAVDGDPGASELDVHDQCVRLIMERQQ